MPKKKQEDPYAAYGGSVAAQDPYAAYGGAAEKPVESLPFQPITLTPPEPSLWDKVNAPLVNEGPAERNAREYAAGLPSEFEINHPKLGGAIRGIVGAGADTLKTARGFTSPASIALLGAGPAARAIPAAAPLLKAAQGAAGLAYGVKGGQQAAEGIGDMVSRGGSIMDGFTPENTEKVLQGGAQLLGGAAGSIEPLYGSSPRAASAINNRVLGTSKKGFSFDRNPGLTVAKEGIVGNSQEGLRDNIKQRIGDLESEKQQVLAGTTKRFDARPMIGGPVRSALDEAQASSNPDLYNSLGKIKDELTGKYEPTAMDIKSREPIGPLVRVGDKNLSNVSALQLNKLKRDVGERTNWQQFGIPYKKPLNALKTEMYSGIDKNLDSSVPRYKDINDSQSGLISGADDLAAKMVRDKKKSIFGLGDAYKTALGAGAGMLTHDPATALAAGTISYAVPRILGSAAVSTRIARALANPSGLEQGIPLIPAAVTSGAGRSGPVIAPSAQTEKRKRQDEEK